MDTFEIDARALRHVAKFTAGDSRPALAGVLVQRNGALVATNGTTLMLWRGALHSAPPPPRDMVLIFPKPILTAAGLRDAFVSVTPAETREVGRFSVRAGNHNRPAVVMEGQEIRDPYPDWRIVFPHVDSLTLDAPPTMYGVDLLAKFSLEKSDTPILLLPSKSARGASVVRYRDEPDALGLIMPCGPADKIPALSAYPAWWETLKQTPHNANGGV